MATPQRRFLIVTLCIEGVSGKDRPIIRIGYRRSAYQQNFTTSAIGACRLPITDYEKLTNKPTRRQILLRETLAFASHHCIASHDSAAGADIKRAGLLVQGPVSDSGWDMVGVGLKLRPCSAPVGVWER